MNVEEAVFPVDFSQRSVDACPYVAAVTRRFSATLILLHVVESLPPGSSALDRLYTSDREELEERKQLARVALTAFQKEYLPHAPSQIVVQAGDPAACIVQYGGIRTGRMIIMPTRGFGPFRTMLLGSVTAKVLHDAKCPVLTGPHLENAIPPDKWLTLQRIVCCIALDWETDQVLQRCSRIASQLGAQVVAAHVITPVEEWLLPLMEPGGPPLSTESVQSEMRAVLERAGLKAEVRVLVGEVSRQIARIAKETDADLVVTGKGGAPELPGRLGSHGYAIVRRSPCPVLCV